MTQKRMAASGGEPGAARANAAGVLHFYDGAVDGSLELFGQLLSVLCKSEDGQPADAPARESPAGGGDCEGGKDER